MKKLIFRVRLRCFVEHLQIEIFRMVAMLLIFHFT
jgi:hypothetical protein